MIFSELLQSKAFLNNLSTIARLHFQTCTLKFGSWTYDGTKVDLDFFDNLVEVDITDYMPSNEWRLLAHPAKKNIKFYPCCSEPYIDLTFTVVIKRIGIYYTYTLILPCVLLSVLTLVVFWIPPESSAKMIIGTYDLKYLSYPLTEGYMPLCS